MFEGGGARGELRSAIEPYRDEDLRVRSDQEVEDGLAELQRAAELIELERLRRLAEMDRRRPWQRDGYLSTTSWFAERFHLAHGAAGNDLRMARSLQQMPATGRALASGEISSSALRLLVAAREACPEEFADGEELLVEAARRHTIRELSRVVAYWRNAAESHRASEHGREGDPLVGRRRLHVSPMAFGMVRIDGDLDPETGETVLAAVRSVVDAELRSPDGDDDRAPAQRRADALGEVCRQFLDSSRRPHVGGERPHITVTVDVDALRELKAASSELEETGPVDPEYARRLACDASIARVVLGPRSEPLDVGRRTDVVPAAMRRAVVARDGGCRFPGCDRPPSWCDAHHIRHWSHGGPTAVSNLTLLCRRHHRLVHQGRFSVEMVRGHPSFRGGDGSVLQSRPMFRRGDGSVLQSRPPPLVSTAPGALTG